MVRERRGQILHIGVCFFEASGSRLENRVKTGFLRLVDFSHAPFTDLFQNLIMTDGLSDHDPPHAMQLASMLDREGAEGNQ